MNVKLWRNLSTPTLAVIAAGLFLWVPTACSDDDGNPFGDEDGGTGGSAGSGGKVGSGGKTGSNTGGAVGAGGGPSSGGTTSEPDASAGGTENTGGKASTGGAQATGGTPTDGGPDGGPVSACSGQIDSDKANLCITYEPDVIATGATPTPDLDGKGTLIVQIYKTATPTVPTDLIDAIVLAPPTQPAAALDVKTLPKVGFDDLPETVYVRTLFVDNQAWFATSTGLTYGMFVGGLDLNAGVRPPPPLRKVTLKNGEETELKQHLTALRKFTTNIIKFPGIPNVAPPLTPVGDGQGPATVGVFDQQSPQGATVVGGAQNGNLTCLDVKNTPNPLAHATGFFYILGTPTAATTMWFGAQVDDFGTAVTSPANPVGAMVSLNQAQLLPDTQKLDVAADAYSVVAPNVTLTAVVTPAPAPGTDSVHCASPDPGDAGDGG